MVELYPESSKLSNMGIYVVYIPGQRVIPTRKVEREVGWLNIWDKEMTPLLGKTMTVVHHDGPYGVLVEENPYRWPPGCLIFSKDTQSNG